ncbi:hypothetical protein ACFVH6_11875 [Spirillospora sp. NPDC127200]
MEIAIVPAMPTPALAALSEAAWKRPVCGTENISGMHDEVPVMTLRPHVVALGER